MSNKIIIGNINNGYIRSEVAGSLILAVIQDSKERNIIDGYIATQSPYIDTNRNDLVELFLNLTSVEWLLFVDSDVEINKNDIYKMYDIATTYNLYVLGSIYFYAEEHHSHRIRPMIMSKSENNYRGDIIYDIPYNKDYFEVNTIGTGALMVHRSVFEKTYTVGADGKKYWFKTYTDETGFLGEDVFFCRMLKNNGYSIYATPQSNVNHYKIVKFNNDLYISQKEMHETKPSEY